MTTETPTAQATMMIEIARSQAEAQGVEEPIVWYCTHMLGERMVLVVNRDIMSTCAMWPGDIVVDDVASAAEWLDRPPEQPLLGRPPVALPPPVGKQTSPEPEGDSIPEGMIVGIRWWVQAVRTELAYKLCLEEVARSRWHEFVELAHTGRPSVHGTFREWPECDCGVMIDPAIEITECPDGLGCRRRRE